MSDLQVVISAVCQWKLITRLNALHPWENYQLSGSCYIDHDNPPAEGTRMEQERKRERKMGSLSRGIKIPHIYTCELLKGSYSIEKLASDK